MRLIYIEWEDAIATSAWYSKEELEKWHNEDRCIVKEVGWVYKENKNYITLVSRISTDNRFSTGVEDTYGHVQKIPRTWIRKRKDLTKWIKNLGKSFQKF